MDVILITAVAAGLFGLLAGNQYKRSKELEIKRGKSSLTTYYMFVIICALILGCVTGFRYYVGTDYGGYYNYFPNYANSFADRLKNFDDPGLALIANILYRFTPDAAYFIFVTSVLTVIPCVITLSKNTDDFFFVLMLYIATAWVGCFNGTRQYLAMAIIFAGHRLIYEKKFIKYCILVFLAASVHITALIMLPMYFIISKNLTFKKIILIVTCGIALVFSYDLLFEMAGVLKDSETTSANTTYAQNEIHPLRVVIAFAPLILYFFFSLQKKTFTEEENFYASILFINFALIFATANSAYLNRVTIYFKPFIALGLCQLCNKFEGRQKNFMKSVVAILYLIVWIYVDCMGVRWHWIFQR